MYLFEHRLQCQRLEVSEFWKEQEKKVGTVIGTDFGLVINTENPKPKWYNDRYLYFV